MALGIKTKFIIGIVLIASIVFSIVALFVVQQQQHILEENFQTQGLVMAKTLDSSIQTIGDLTNKKYLQNTIYKLMWLNPDIFKVNINVPEKGELKILASNNTAIIDASAAPDNNYVFQTGKDLVKRGVNSLTVISPVHIGGKIAGTYEIGISLAGLKNAVRKSYFNLFIIFLGGIAGLILITMVFIQFVIINPIRLLQKGTQEFGSGNLKWRIPIKSRDEFGRLALSFNQMAQALESNYLKQQKLYQELQQLNKSLERKVKERTKELEEAKLSLEKKVKERTKTLEELKEKLEEKVKERTIELQKRIEELERIQKITMGRELKMIELKKTIEKLKKQLENCEKKMGQG